MLCGLYFFIWVRATMPRLRYDMLMKFGWQGLLPIALVNILLTAFGVMMYAIYGLGGYGFAFLAWFVIFGFIILPAFALNKRVQLFTTNTRRNTTVVLHSSAQPYRAVAEHSGERRADAAAGRPHRRLPGRGDRRTGKRRRRRAYEERLTFHESHG